MELARNVPAINGLITAIVPNNITYKGVKRSIFKPVVWF